MRDMQLSVQYLSMFVSRTLSISMSMPLLCRSEWRCVSIHGSGWCCVHLSGWLHRCSMVNDRVELPCFELICPFVVKSRCFPAIPIPVSRSLWLESRGWNWNAFLNRFEQGCLSLRSNHSHDDMPMLWSGNGQVSDRSSPRLDRHSSFVI